jgi:hypothetical protein
MKKRNAEFCYEIRKYLKRLGVSEAFMRRRRWFRLAMATGGDGERAALDFFFTSCSAFYTIKLKRDFRRAALNICVCGVKLCANVFTGVSDGKRSRARRS